MSKKKKKITRVFGNKKVFEDEKYEAREITYRDGSGKVKDKIAVKEKEKEDDGIL